MNYPKKQFVGGKWAKASELGNVKRARIVSETNPQPSQFLNEDGSKKTQDVCKVQFEGIAEALNVSLNRATINGLSDAFGEDSKNWQGKNLTVKTEGGRVGGKIVTYLYLIPDGYEQTNDENMYAVITKKGTPAGDPLPPMESLPF